MSHSAWGPEGWCPLPAEGGPSPALPGPLTAAGLGAWSPDSWAWGLASQAWAQGRALTAHLHLGLLPELLGAGQQAGEGIRVHSHPRHLAEVYGDQHHRRPTHGLADPPSCMNTQGGWPCGQPWSLGSTGARGPAPSGGRMGQEGKGPGRSRKEGKIETRHLKWAEAADPARG